jgi:hypothetical protein
MAQLLRANKPTTLVCTGNLDHEMEWDSDDMLFLVEYDEKILKELERDGYRMHPLVPEIIVWGKQLDFQTTFIARKEDFDEVEMF